MNKVPVTEDNLKILICCHKPCDLPKSKVFLPVQAGAAISKFDLGMQRDDQVKGLPCDNISKKNPLYAELTVLYWAWKNIKKIYPNIEYIGLNHYRRYFSFDKNILCDNLLIKEENKVGSYLLDLQKIQCLMKKYDAIIAKEEVLEMPVLLGTLFFCNGNDYRLIRQAVSEYHPEYEKTFHEVMEGGNKLSPYNMFIMKYDEFCCYCEWLFDICSKVEDKIPYETYTLIDKRAIGVFAERLTHIYFQYNKTRLHIKKIIVLWFTNEKKTRSFPYRLYKRMRHVLAAKLTLPVQKHKRYL